MIIQCRYQDLAERCEQRNWEFSRAMGCICKKIGKSIWVDTEHPDYPAVRLPRGPGTVLKVMLRRLGFTSGECGCSDYARKMNLWGTDGCRARLGEITRHLQEQAKTRGIPAPELLVRRLVLFAIQVAETKRERRVCAHK